MGETPAIGTIGWVDLTIEHADAVRDFYREVVGWSVSAVDMGGYNDYCMLSSSGAPVAGLCHARGANLGLPAQWLVYITVADVDTAAARCLASGGRIVRPAKEMGPNGRFCVIQDPAGAVCALFQPAPTARD